MTGREEHEHDDSTHGRNLARSRASPLARRRPAWDVSRGVQVVDIQSEVRALVRRRRGAMTAALARRHGPTNLELVEGAIEAAAAQAIARWPTLGLPEDP